MATAISAGCTGTPLFAAVRTGWPNDQRDVGAGAEAAMPDNIATMGGFTVRISRFEAECYIVELEPAMRVVSKGGKLPKKRIVCPQGFDRAIIPHLPISLRTLYALRDADLLVGTNQMTVGDLLRVKGIGPRSVSDLISCLWGLFTDISEGNLDFESDPDLDSVGGGKDTPENIAFGLTPEEAFGPEELEPDELSMEDSARVLRSLIDAAQEGGTTPSFSPEMAEILGTARELYGDLEFWDLFAPCIQRIAAVLLPNGIIEGFQTKSFIGPGLVQVTATRAWDRYKLLPLERRTVVDHRMLASPHKSLEDIAEFLGCTEQQIIQHELAFEEEVEEDIGGALDQVAQILENELADAGAVTERTCARRLEVVFSRWEGIGHSLVRHFVWRRLQDAAARATRPKVVDIWGSGAPEVH